MSRPATHHRQGFLSNLRLGAGALRLAMNLWPPFVGAGIRVLSIAPDFREVKVRMKLKWFNRNYYGTHFGGSLFAMADPFFVLMLAHNLGRGYVVWDKGAHIHFKSPGRGVVFARFHIDEAQIEEAREKTAGGEKFEPIYTVDVVDAHGKVIASLDKTLYIRRKDAAGSAKLAP